MKNPGRLPPSPLIGKEAPNFSLKNMDSGEIIDKQILKGKPYILNFFASWCRECVTEHKVLQKLSEKLFVFGVIYQDTPENIRKYREQFGEGVLYYIDEKGRVAIEFGVYGVPETFFVNRNGFVFYKHIGPLDLTTALDKVKELEKF